MLSLPFFSERMRDGSLTEDMAEKLWGQRFGYDDDGAALTCGEGRSRSFWDEVYELGYHADWRRLILANEETGHMHIAVGKGQMFYSGGVSAIWPFFLHLKRL